MKILVLAGGADQIALIKELKTYNHEIILVDYFENPPAKKVADKHIIASTLDIQKIQEIALSENVELITTACTDQALLTAAKVSESLSLPCYISYQTALNVTNKAFMKKKLFENQILTPKYIITDSIDISILDEFIFPLVIKPVDCNSSKGVKKVANKADLLNALQEAIALSRTHTAIVEEFKEGMEISVDFYVENGIAKLLSATGSNKIANTNSFTITQSVYPAVSEANEKELIKIGQAISSAFNLVNTPLLVQLIENDGIFNVLEFSARMGGGSKYKLIESLSGVNIMGVYVDLILGNKPNVTPQKKTNYALMNYVYCHPGKFNKITGFEELKEKQIIDEFFLYKTSGMEITKSETSSDRVAGFLITSQDKKTLDEKLRSANKRIEVLNDKNEDIMIHSLFNLE